MSMDANNVFLEKMILGFDSLPELGEQEPFTVMTYQLYIVREELHSSPLTTPHMV